MQMAPWRKEAALARLSKEALLGASDLTEREVELPSIGGSVKVRSLPAAYSSQALTEAVKFVMTPRGEQIATYDTAKLEILQVLHALIEPKLNSIQEAEQFAQNCGPAFREVVRVIDEISGVDKDAIEQAEATFPASGGSANGSDVEAGPPAGGVGPDIPVRAGGEAGDAGQ